MSGPTVEDVVRSLWGESAVAAMKRKPSPTVGLRLEHGPETPVCGDEPSGVSYEGPCCELLPWHEGPHQKTYWSTPVRWDR